MDAKAIMLAIHIVCGFVALVTMVMAYLIKRKQLSAQMLHL